MTDTQKQLLQQIIANPAEDSIRLVYADLLQEQGEEERAEFIRVQIELGAKPQEDTLICPKCLRQRHGNGLSQHLFYCKSTKGEELRQRESELTGRNFVLWQSDIPNGLSRLADGWEYEYTRGFISHVTCTAEDWIQHADALVWREEFTDPCRWCDGTGAWEDAQLRDMYTDCKRCGGNGKLPRPMPDSAQPIERVTLTTHTGWPVHLKGEAPIRTVAASYLDGSLGKDRWAPWIDNGDGGYANSLWPKITFTLPPQPGADPVFLRLFPDRVASIQVANGERFQMGDAVYSDPNGYATHTTNGVRVGVAAGEEDFASNTGRITGRFVNVRLD